MARQREREGTAQRRGFTMVELLTVIAILAILAAIASPVIPSVRAGGRATGKVE